MNNNFLKPWDFYDKFYKCIDELKNQDNIFIWLSWWTSLNNFYDWLIRLFENLDKKINEKIVFFLLDERFVPLEDDESNYKSIYNIFFSKLFKKNILTSKQVIKFDISSGDNIDNYSNKIKKIDIALFWVWDDWHIASLFPNHKLLLNEEKKYLEIYDSPKNPPHRISISKNMISSIIYSFVFFMWEKKKSALINFYNPEINYISSPVNLIKKNKNYFLVSDIREI